MGRRSHSQTLTLWANGEYGPLDHARGDMELQYDAGWLASPRGRPVSLSRCPSTSTTNC
jgi:serine/threonine-protein kinase HipA